uniref:Uncharacterized protein n=1 Tax=Cacopsylla melanoneura TaxID=428564 RepID=A0A8D8SF92_9HEMI
MNLKSVLIRTIPLPGTTSRFTRTPVPRARSISRVRTVQTLPPRASASGGPKMPGASVAAGIRLRSQCQTRARTRAITAARAVSVCMRAGVCGAPRHRNVSCSQSTSPSIKWVSVETGWTGPIIPLHFTRMPP